MIKSITVTNYLGESIKLELRRPEDTGLLIQSIDGLGPCKATINTTDLSINDGSIFNSSRITPRNIILTLGFQEKPTIEDTRQLSYKYFPVKKQLKFSVETDNRNCYIYGYVESNEPVIFSSEENTQISIICPNPYFYSVETNTTVFSGIESMFEFEFSNESLNENTIEFSNITNDINKTVRYTGDAEIGITITIYSIGDAKNITIYNSNTRETMKINTDRLYIIIGSYIESGDEITISTVKGSKSITLLRNSEYINIINCLDRYTDWFKLEKGDNVFSYTAESGALNLQFRIENQIVYEGI